MGAEELIFWLAPVALLVVFTLVLANHTRDPRRRKLLFVEPLGTLITKWRPIRFVGETPMLQQALAVLAASRFHDGAPLELVLTFEAPLSLKTYDILERRRIGAWSEQRVVTIENQAVSLIAGSVEDVVGASRYRSDGRTLLAESDRAEVKLTAERAGQHGYLALGLARRHFHSRVFEPTKHTWLGLVLLEPIIDNSIQHQLRQILPNRRKLLSVLPSTFLGSLVGKLGAANQFTGVPTATDSSPKAQEETWEHTSAIGSASHEQRHALVRYFEPRRDCRLLSVLPEDEALPIRIVRQL